ncbi:MAG TPA: PAS domain-containing protein, partial [Longimicrobiaceae bacterium]|nr:PAS domain-containing protein [Longimicrobiaceae bacterium]
RAEGRTPPHGDVVIGEALPRALFYQSPFSTVIYDPEGHPLAVNPAFERLWGVSLETVPPGYTILADAELERQGVLPVIRRAFAGEEVVTPPVRYDISNVSLSGTGRSVWTQGYFYPVRDSGGCLTHVVLTHFDLTELKEREEALREQEERLRLAQRAARIGTFDWHIPSGRVAWTEDEEQLFGLEPGTFEGTIEGWERRVLPDDLARMREAAGEAMAQGEREMDFAFRIRRPDGEVRWIEGSASLLYADDGTPLRMVGVNVDVTERRRAEAERQRNAELLHETERIAHIGSWVWDIPEGGITWSEELYRLFGLDPAEGGLTFEGFLAQVHLEDREFVRQAVERALQDHRPFAFDHRIVQSDGSVRYLHGRGRVVTDEEGRPVRMLGSGQDITERKLTEEALRRAKEEAEAASRAKSDFLAVMSHELRTPLNAIGGYAELIELGIRGPVTEMQREDLRRIQQSQRHLLGLINEVLNYARVEAGAVSYDLSEVRVAEALAAAEALVLPQVSARGLTLEVSPPTPELSAWVDRERLQQILLNLLSNAVKFTGSGGRICVEAEEEGEHVAIRVRDSGVGIPPEKLPGIFEPFVQVGRALNNPSEGVGLGLAISRDLARGMGGDLVAESEAGVGSVFTLLLPRHA